MGQQQILFVILVVCIIGISVSVGVLSIASQGISDDRALVEQDLKAIAQKVQNYVSHPGGKSEREGEMSFSLLSRLPNPLGRLGIPSSNAHGDFFVMRSDNPSSLRIIGIGTEAGVDKRHPLRIVVTVWADRTALKVLN